MRIGMSITSHHPGLQPRQAAANMIERVRVAGEAGLAHVTFGDKHAVGSDGLYVQGIPILARALAEWPADRPAGLLFLVPLWHPVHMAEQIGTLAALTDAPLIVQTGIGGGAEQFAAFGASLRTRGREIDRRIDLVKRLLDGESVSDSDLGIVNAAIGPRPQESVEWWIGSGAPAVAIERAAREGDALYLSPHWTVDELRTIAGAYRDACRRRGVSSRVVARRDVLLSSNHETAVAEADRQAAVGYRGMGRRELVAGGAASALAQLEEFRLIGVDDVVARVMAVSQDQAVETIGLLGEVQASFTPRDRP